MGRRSGPFHGACMNQYDVPAQLQSMERPESEMPTDSGMSWEGSTQLLARLSSLEILTR